MAECLDLSSVLRKEYGLTTAKKWKRIVFDISSVLLGWKKAWLIDYFNPSPTKLQILSQNILAKLKCRSKCYICIVSINGDSLIVNIENLILACERLLKSHEPEAVETSCMFVVLGGSTPHLATDSEMELIKGELKEAIFLMNSSLKTIFDEVQGNVLPSTSAALVHQSEVPIVTLSLSVNMCTLFGWLLGYPVVYWFPQEVTDPCASLKMVPLTVHKLSVCPKDLFTLWGTLSKDTADNKEFMTLVSFSYPTSVGTSYAELLRHVDQWCQRLEVELLLDGTALHKHSEIVTLPHVIL